MARAPYREPGYLAALEVLAHGDIGCWYGCGARATSPDHWPPLSLHDHEPGSGCCELRPACLPCQLSGGARLAARARRRSTRSRLTPGSGALR